MSLFRSIATVGGFTLISRITGFIRDILLAHFLGAGMAADAFFVAFKFPNLFRRLFGEGAFNAAFVPLFAKELEEDLPDVHRHASKFSAQAFSWLFAVLFCFVVIIEIAMPWAIYLIAPGFDSVPGKIELAQDLARITFPYLLFISLVSLLAGILNSLHHFAAAAATPILLNLTLIASLFLLPSLTGSVAYALAVGVFLAGVVQFIWLYGHVYRKGFGMVLVRPRLSPKVKTLMRRIVPGIVGASIYQINLLVDTILATMVAQGAVSWLYYADRVNQMPLGVVGVAVGTALLPLLSRQIKADKIDLAHYTQNRALEFALLLTVPAASGLFFLAEPIVAVLFERGAFSLAETRMTALALKALACGLPAYVAVKVFAPGFFAREDTATPVKVAGVALVVNVVLNLILMKPFGHVGIAAATACSAWLNAIVLFWLLNKRGFFTLDSQMIRRGAGIVMASIVMGGCLYAVSAWIADRMPEWLHESEISRVPILIGLIALGKLTFMLTASMMGAFSVTEVIGMLRRTPTPKD